MEISIRFFREITKPFLLPRLQLHRESILPRHRSNFIIIFS